MKKIILTLAFGMTSLVFAKTGDIKVNNHKNKKNEKIQQKEWSCITYGILIGCTNQMITDTACGDSYNEIRACMIKNGRLAQEYFCGGGQQQN